MATLNIQTATKGVYSINLQTTPPASGPYVAVQGENTDVYYAPAIKTTCGPIAVQVNDCASACCWPVRRLTNAVLEHYLICRVTDFTSNCCPIVMPRDWFEYGPVDVAYYPPFSGACVCMNTSASLPRCHTPSVVYGWAIANNIWYTSFSVACDGVAIAGGGPWPAGLGYQPPDAMCPVGIPAGGCPNEWSCVNKPIGHNNKCHTQLYGLHLTNAAGGPNNDIQWTWGNSQGICSLGGQGHGAIIAWAGGWCTAATGSGWAIQNWSYELCTDYDSYTGLMSCLLPATAAVPRASVICNIMPTGAGTITLQGVNTGADGWVTSFGLCANPNSDIPTSQMQQYYRVIPNFGVPITSSRTVRANIFGANGCCIFADIEYCTYTPDQGNTNGWLNNQMDANAPIYAPDPYHYGYILEICGWRYVEPTP